MFGLPGVILLKRRERGPFYSMIFSLPCPKIQRRTLTSFEAAVNCYRPPPCVIEPHCLVCLVLLSVSSNIKQVSQILRRFAIKNSLKKYLKIELYESKIFYTKQCICSGAETETSAANWWSLKTKLTKSLKSFWEVVNLQISEIT